MLESEMAAAVAGGVTSLVCPPDTDPVLDSPAWWRCSSSARRKAPPGACSPWAPSRAAWRARCSPNGRAHRIGLRGLQPGRCGAGQHPGVLQRALQYAATYGYTVWLRPQELYLGTGVAASGPLATRLGLSGVPVAAETIALHTIFELLKATDARAPVPPLQRCRARLVRQAKAEGSR